MTTGNSPATKPGLLTLHDEFKIPTDAALGGTDGNGFKQLMTTFEGARIQTAARAVGVAENAFELALSYASQRQQFGQSLLGFERIYGKIARMAADVMTARQLTYRAARIKDKAIRCDIDAGMAKLYAARTAWTCADNAVQIHGGAGYALRLFYLSLRQNSDSQIDQKL